MDGVVPVKHSKSDNKKTLTNVRVLKFYKVIL